MCDVNPWYHCIVLYGHDKTFGKIESKHQYWYAQWFCHIYTLRLSFQAQQLFTFCSMPKFCSCECEFHQSRYFAVIASLKRCAWIIRPIFHFCLFRFPVHFSQLVRSFVHSRPIHFGALWSHLRHFFTVFLYSVCLKVSSSIANACTAFFLSCEFLY